MCAQICGTELKLGIEYVVTDSVSPLSCPVPQNIKKNGPRAVSPAAPAPS